MTLVVETGGGVPGANAYCTAAFVTTYLTNQARQTEGSWSTSTSAVQDAAVVKATAYIDQRFGRRFLGIRANASIVGRRADGTVKFAGLPVDADTITIGRKTYRFVATLAQENDVLIGATAALTAEALLDALNADTGDSTVHEDTLKNYEVIATRADAVLTIEAVQYGENGNSIALSESATNVTVLPAGGFLTGGVDAAPQPLCFPRLGLYDRDGYEVIGVPERLRQAVAEYAVRSLSSTLAPDPSHDESGSRVQRTRSKVGPLEDETEFVQGSALVPFRPYPAADALLAEYLAPAGAYR